MKEVFFFIVVTLNWLQEPRVKSYDVFGAYLDNVSPIGTVNTNMVNNNGSISYSVNKSASNGFGVGPIPKTTITNDSDCNGSYCPFYGIKICNKGNGTLNISGTENFYVS